jgi:Protein of unknown function (DUF664)
LRGVDDRWQQPIRQTGGTQVDITSPIVSAACHDRRMTDKRIEFPNVADERTLLTGFLDFQRQTLEWKCEGLTDEQLRTRAVDPSGLSLLGLVRHLTEVERGWFRAVISGEEVAEIYCSERNRDGDFDLLDSAPVAEVFARWKSEIEASQAITAARKLDAVGTRVRRTAEARTGETEEFSLRWVLIHMIEEYARHNGHADLLRERIDGAVGE